LNPELVYGSESRTVSKGTFPEILIGILTPLEPWAGVQTAGAEEGIIETRPWAAENEQLLKNNQKNSKHPSVVTPPRYDTTENIHLRLC